MLIYFVVYVILLILSLVDFVLKKDLAYSIIFVVSGMFILLYAGFRTCSIDYEGYRQIFLSLDGGGLKRIFDSDIFVEPGFALLNILIGNFEGMIFVMAFINILILFPFFRKYSPYPFITLLCYSGLFLYSGLMGLIRQSLAVSICLWAMTEPKNRRFLLLVAGAMTFHVTSIIVVLVKLLKRQYFELRTYILIGLAAVASNMLFYNIFRIFVKYLPPFMEMKLEYYLAFEAGTTFGFNEAVMIRLFTFSLAYIYRSEISKVFPKYGPLFVNIYFLALVAYTGFGFLPQMAARGAMYFHYAELLVVPMILYVSSNVVRAPLFILYASFALMRNITMLTTHAEYYVPYTNWLFN